MTIPLLVTLAAGTGILTGCKKKSRPAASSRTDVSPQVQKAADAATAAAVQTTCPVMGNSIDRNVYVEYKGKKVYFCCAACRAEFAENPEKYVNKLPQFKNQEPDTLHE